MPDEIVYEAVAAPEILSASQLADAEPERVVAPPRRRAVVAGAGSEKVKAAAGWKSLRVRELM